MDERPAANSPPTAALPDARPRSPPARRHRPHGGATTATSRPTRRWSAEALQSVCSIPLPQRAYQRAAAPTRRPPRCQDWIPANFAGPNGAKVFTRRSDKTLRVGIAGVFTYAGFHDVVLARLEDVAGQAALDRSVFAGGCPESAEASVAALAEDMLKLYYEDFIAQWDGFLRDVRWRR